MKHTREIKIGNSVLEIETGRMAKQADGSCITRIGDAMVLTTACATPSAQPRDFLPLTVDYREYAAAGGRIPGGFFKREGRPSEKEIITCRMIDRPLRPLFPEGYTHETQIISLVLSSDGENDTDILAINGASTALVLSDVPFYEAVGAVRIALVEDEMIFNPTNSERDVADLDLVVVATDRAVVMVEAAANQLPESVVLDCIFAAQEEAQKLIRAQRDLFDEMGLSKPEWQEPETYSSESYETVKAALREPLNTALHTAEKFARKKAVSAVVDAYLETLPEDDEGARKQTKKIVHALEEELLRDAVLQDRTRFDGRALDEIRNIDIEAGLLPRSHGSALFTRGETQALATVTLGTRRDAQLIESYEGDTFQKFLLHYNFPPFSVGEVRFLRGPGRREIGHGVLARRALMSVLPHEDDFPYTLRVVSDILESNGSSSMATVCGASLSLFDAGVPLLAPVAGVAMGLVVRGDDFGILSDIAGQEDHYGDMDFKVAGTREGITALQMDIKIDGVSKEIMGAALQQAQAGRFHILDKMEAILETPREEISALAPRLHTLQVPPDKIRDIIGPGGKTIRSIQEETGCEVEIENDGKVTVAAPDGPAARRAIELIEELTEVPEVGRVYTGKVQRIEAYGAFIEILPGTDGLVHISELAPYRVGEVRDILTEGDEVTVKVVDIEPPNKVRLSRKAVIVEAPDYDPKKYEGMGAEEPRDGDRGRGGDRGGRGGDRGGRGGDRGGRGGRGGDRGGRR
jgi:polyribonucleotide nucleotidyltransferase